MVDFFHKEFLSHGNLCIEPAKADGKENCYLSANGKTGYFQLNLIVVCAIFHHGKHGLI
jgi:hypothetical protein